MIMRRFEAYRVGRLAARTRRGAALVIAAVMLMVALAMAAFAIDLGYIQLVQAELQNAADGAAIAGAQALADGPTSARAAACRVAEKNEAGNRPIEMVASSDVEIGTWDKSTAQFTVLSGADEARGTAVRVTCRRTAERGNGLSLFFAPVLGHHEADVVGVATAACEGQTCSRLIGLDWVWLENGNVDSYNSDAGSYESQTPGENAHVCSNGSITVGSNGFVHGDARPGPGYTVSGSSRVSGSTEPRDEPIEAPPVDPGSATTENDNDQIPAGLLVGNDFVLEGSNTVSLPPGTYYVDGEFRIGGSACLDITGPTKIYVTGNVSIEGNGVTGTTPSNLEFYATGSTARIAGDRAFKGAIYAPTTELTISGKGGVYGAVLGKTLKLEGNPTNVHYDEAIIPFSSEFGRGKLVQ